MEAREREYLESLLLLRTEIVRDFLEEIEAVGEAEAQVNTSTQIDL